MGRCLSIDLPTLFSFVGVGAENVQNPCVSWIFEQFYSANIIPVQLISKSPKLKVGTKKLSKYNER